MSSPASTARARARAVADAVLYEGYLLYPYRAGSAKNHSRWQFGVLGPVGAAAAGLGEESTMSAQFLMRPADTAEITVTFRFLQAQRRTVENAAGVAVDRLDTGDRRWITWDEAVEQEIELGPVPPGSRTWPVHIAAGREAEPIIGAGGEVAGRLIRTRAALDAQVSLSAEPDGGCLRVTLVARNTGAPASDAADALARSPLGAHILAEAVGTEFVSLLDPPPDAAAAAGRCTRQRWFPVLAGPAGDRSLLLIAPIILYDHPEIAEQSPGPLFDSTEIDEILTLRVLTMTDDEKAQARATDPQAARLVDRCEEMTPEEMGQLHGVLRSPHPAEPRLVPEVPDGLDWWDPVADSAVRPESDAVTINGVRVARGSPVRLHPARRADAQDLFFDNAAARVTTVHADVDGEVHVGVVLDDDPAADLHEWFGRYLYFAPDEIEPLHSEDNGKEGPQWQPWE
ncbi:hypothetical protein ACWCPQ_02490 [Nocardia sp. NPDC001965]